MDPMLQSGSNQNPNAAVMSTRSGGRSGQLSKAWKRVQAKRGQRQSPWCLMKNAFRRVAKSTSIAMGSPFAFALAAGSVVVWALLGPKFQYSQTWQLVINTGTTIVTFLMIFLVQNSQNRDSRAIHLKLDELLRGVRGARTGMVDLEEATDEELEQLEYEFKALRGEDDGKDEDESKE
jgi:low affinity Fe/Cu permease